MNPSLYVFDLDGTLVEKWGTTLLPGVAERVRGLDGDIAVATNQAGVAWNAVEGKPYPLPSEMGRRLVRVAETLPRLLEALWLVAIADERLTLTAQQWRALAAGVTRAASPLHVRTSSDAAWRKPRPGMLLQACRVFKVAAEDAVFVGDHQVDTQAAEAAGIRFLYADQFFDRA
ncbi:MAG: HAD-IIIA family hydrolase [Anaerolineae bacterium]|jgi:HAD superfamily hydrolase (TIGR01662 family)